MNRRRRHTGGKPCRAGAAASTSATRDTTRTALPRDATRTALPRDATRTALPRDATRTALTSRAARDATSPATRGASVSTEPSGATEPGAIAAGAARLRFPRASTAHARGLCSAPGCALARAPSGIATSAASRATGTAGAGRRSAGATGRARPLAFVRAVRRLSAATTRDGERYRQHATQCSPHTGIRARFTPAPVVHAFLRLQGPRRRETGGDGTRWHTTRELKRPPTAFATAG
jgi:hypothetical protein